MKICSTNRSLSPTGRFIDRFVHCPGIQLPQAVYGYFSNGGSRCYVVSVRTFPKAEAELLNAQGKPALKVRARQAGVEGLKMRVRVADLQLPAPAAKKAGAKEGEEGEQPAAPEAGEGTFTLFVEKEAATGGWKPLEVLTETKLQTAVVEGKKQVAVAYKNNRFPKFIELTVLEPGSIEKASPREQEQLDD